MTMKPKIISRIAAAVFASMTLLLSLSLVLTPARSALKPSLLYATAEAGTKLITIMTCSPDGTLYAIGQFNSTDPAFNSLYTVNRETGLASRIGSTGVLDPSDPSGFSGFLMALAFAPDGTLYGANSASTLFRVNTATGEA